MYSDDIYPQVVLISKPVEEGGVATYIFGQAHSDFAQSTIEWPVLDVGSILWRLHHHSDV
jgi:hypothetical protein